MDTIGGIYIYKILYVSLFYFSIFFPVIFFSLLWFLNNKFGKKIVLIYILLLPLFSFILCNACVWSGFHYRMELRERFGKDELGNININRMSCNIRTEYDANGGHPRQRNCIGMLFSGWFVLPLYCLALTPFYLFFQQVVKTWRGHIKEPRIS